MSTIERTLTVKKKQTETYKLSYNYGSFGYANFTLDELGPKSGSLLIQSDYGSYDYQWGSCGVSFKEFLIKISPDYLLSKLGKRNEFNLNNSINGVKREIEEYFKELKVHYTDLIRDEDEQEKYEGPEYLLNPDDQIEYDEFIEEIEQFRNHCSDSSHDFVYNFPIRIFKRIYNDDYSSLPLCHEYASDLRQLVECVWPDFINVLKEELNGKVYSS